MEAMEVQQQSIGVPASSRVEGAPSVSRNGGTPDGAPHRSSAGVSFVAVGEHAGSVAGSDASAVGAPMHGGGSHSDDDRQEAAMSMWREWAEEALGPMSSEPSPAQLSSKTKRAKALERKCAELAAAAQRRLTASATLRDGGNLVASTALLGGSRSRRAASARPARVPAQQAGWAARELRKSKAYAAVQSMGRAERESAGAGDPQIPAARRAPSPPPPARSKSHAMLNAMLQGGTPEAAATSSPQGNSQRGPPALQRQLTRYTSGFSRSASKRPQTARSSSTANLDNSAASLLTRSPPRTRSSGARPASALATSSAAGLGAYDRDAAAALLESQAEAESLRCQLDQANTAVEAHGEVEAQLRDTIDLLRARLHGQSQRELENQRRLQQHAHLEPLFDRLAESFSFSTPEQVLDRLELLEDDRLGTFDQLLQTQDEVTNLQSRVDDANRRVELVRTQLTTEHLRNSARLQQQNDELRAELESVEHLNRRLEERQGQLVTLQSAVADLWGICQEDPRFVAANSQDGSGADAPSGSPSGLDDPLTVLSTCKEYVIAKSGPMANRHYLDVQRIANRVWSRHFVHKKGLRGKVLETFEQLSTLADIMAAKIKTTSDQLKRSKANEKFLNEALGRVDRQRRVLESQVQERERLVRDMSGVPRKERDAASVARTLDAVGPSVLLSGAQGGSRSAHMPASGPSMAGACTRPHSARFGATAVVQHAHTCSSPQAHGTGGGARPTSAPPRRHLMSRAATMTRLVEENDDGSCGDVDGGAASGGAPRKPLACRGSTERSTGAGRHVHVSQAPAGEHWSSFKKRSGCTAPGALFTAGSSGAGAADAATASDRGSAPRWLPPTASRLSIEASFLSRLGRAA